jgi:hypothetical protein
MAYSRILYFRQQRRYLYHSRNVAETPHPAGKEKRRPRASRGRAARAGVSTEELSDEGSARPMRAEAKRETLCRIR